MSDSFRALNMLTHPGAVLTKDEAAELVGLVNDGERAALVLCGAPFSVNLPDIYWRILVAKVSTSHSAALVLEKAPSERLDQDGIFWLSKLVTLPEDARTVLENAPPGRLPPFYAQRLKELAEGKR